MSVAVANLGPAPDELSLRRFLIYSVCLHGAIALALGTAAYLQFRGDQWNSVGGNLGDSVTVNLVSPAGINLPKPDNFTDSHAVDPTKGMYKEEPKPPDLGAVSKDALEIPKFKEDAVIKPPVRPDSDFKDEPRKKPEPHKSKVFEDLRPTPNNAVNYGKGGSPNLPNGFGNNPGQAAAGVQVQGQGGGDFTTRYGWYIDAVRRKINSNWDQFTIDAAVRSARRAKTTMTFTIYRDGSVRNVRMEQSSNNLSMDNSAQRALLASSPMPALPNDYSGSYVNVTFDFDLSMSR
jgi:TonB family protein